MRRLFQSLALLLVAPSLALAAIASVGDTTANDCLSTTSSSALVCTTNATVEVGNVHVVAIAADNVGTTDADHGEINSVVDQASNTYSKLCEFSNGQGGAGAGATISLWQSRLTVQLTSGDTFTINFANSITRKVANGWKFTADNPLAIAGLCQTAAQDGTTATGSLAVSGLSSAETLFFRPIAVEVNGGGSLTVTADFTSIGSVLADGGSVATSMKLYGEFRIVTATGATSNPTLPFSGDNVSVFVALREQAEAAALSGQLRRRN